MKYIQNTTDFKFNNTAVSLGKFDGLHRGHRILIDEIIDAKDSGLSSVIFTFAKQPGSVIHHSSSKQIMTNEERRRCAVEAGADILIEYPVNETTMNMSASDFIKEILVDKLDAKKIVIGSDFRFGHNRVGDATLLQEASEKYGFEVVVHKKEQYNGRDISSTYVRELIAEGDIETANILLGYELFITGTVITGNKLGRTFGIPTINISPSDTKLLPPNGVYASTTEVDGKEYRGITNIGKKPTIEGEYKCGVETHLFDFSGDLYGKEVIVRLYKYERPEKKFDSIEELIAQMNRDIVFSKEYFKGVCR